MNAAWLVEREQRYGGRVEMGRNVGGDRMADHGYADAYARHLAPFLAIEGVVLVEVGILRGTGLAMWCDLFPHVIGLDHDLAPFREFKPTLRKLGAFTRTEPEVYRFDQAEETAGSVGALLAGRKVGIVIDDASHVDALTLRTLEAFRPHLAPGFAYFVEDSPRVSRIHTRLQKVPGMTASRIHRSLTVLK